MHEAGWPLGLRPIGRIALVAAALLLAAAGCGSDGQPASNPDWKSAGTPKPIAPTQPGVIELGPPGLQLPPGGSAELVATLRDSEGAVQPPPAKWSFVSKNPEIVSVDSVGAIHAEAEGIAEIVVTDEQHGIASAWVRVTSTPDSGPTGIACSPSVVFVKVGQPAELPLSASDGAGNAVDSSGVSLSAGSAEVVFTGAKVTVQKAGAYPVIARAADGRPLQGECVVVATDTNASASASASTEPPPSEPAAAGSCTPWQLSHAFCWSTRTPVRYTRPGLADELRVSLVRVYVQECPGQLDGEQHEVIQGAPHKVDLLGDGVVGIDAEGLLRSYAPGTARVRQSADGELCGEFRTVVDLDVNGDWAADCKDYQGSIHIEGAIALVDTRRYGEEEIHGAGAVSGGFVNNAHGTACWAHKQSGPACSGKAEMSSWVTADGYHACSPDLPCNSVGLLHCLNQGDQAPVGGGGPIDGPDSFYNGDCTFKRGPGSVPCEGGSATVQVTFDGKSYAGPPLAISADVPAAAGTNGTYVGLGHGGPGSTFDFSIFLYLVKASAGTYTYEWKPGGSSYGNLDVYPSGKQDVFSDVLYDCGSTVTFSKVQQESDGSYTLTGTFGGSVSSNCDPTSPSYVVPKTVSGSFDINTTAASKACCSGHGGHDDSAACGPKGELPCNDGTFSNECKC